MDVKAVENKSDDKQESDTPLPPHQTQVVENSKVASILNACKAKDSEALRAFALSKGGLISDDVRRHAC